MSRLGFRARVDAPRPTAAWVLVSVASVTLWITQQLDGWAIAVQAAAILVSLLRRERPAAWQRSAVLLNLGMAGIVAATIAVALRGAPSTIALAHFAALTQGLQLLDARPRHTEFLLVTMALFQVILAANLTDSVLFPPLLAAFVLAAVWTLLVHTLRMEAIEARDPQGVGRALTPGLLRVTLVASGVSVLLALALFLVLPRLRSSVYQGTSLAPLGATAGFSDRVALGEIGRIRLDPTVVMRVETLAGRAPLAGSGYWRGLAFDRFDGAAWSITPARHEPVAGSAESGIAFGRVPAADVLVQRIVREPVEAGALFAAGEVRELQGTLRRVERDTSGGLYAAGQGGERVRYTVETDARRWREEALRRDSARPPARLGERYLELPPLSPAVAALAREITRESATDADRVRAVERWLLAHGHYTNVPPDPDPALGSPVEAFLFGRLAGHCEYFASAMVVLVRSLGLPARLVNGFAGGRENEIGGFVELTRADAHAWVEVHYAGAGWVRYDPTPADLRARPALALGFTGHLRELGSALELWWYQRVLGFDRADQIHALQQAWFAWQRAREPDRDEGARLRASSPLPAWTPGRGAGAAALAGAGALGAWLALRRRRARAGSPVPAAYRQALRALARRGLVRDPADTARAFARRVRAAQPGPVGAAFESLTEAYLAERFGGRPARAAEHLGRLRAALRR